MQILLFGVLTFVVCAFFLAVYFINIRSAYKAQRLRQEGKPQPKFTGELRELLDGKLQDTLLTLPIIGIMAFTVLPLLFMILIAFTNFDRSHQPPQSLFTWIGFGNFADVFVSNPVKTRTFVGMLVWTLIWAVFATFLNYIFGMIVALLINKKGIKLKALWRFCFVMSIAVPAFVTLLLMRQLLQEQGAINTLLMKLGWIQAPVKFLTDTGSILPNVTVIVVNLWIGIPYTILITSGILMNIPEDLYEAARIDGATPVKQFTAITLPYMLFVTTPYLITQFMGNINNFNAIYFLTAGGPTSLDYYQGGKTDLLVTWLFKLTNTVQDYNLASAIGILLFLILATVTLVTFNITASAEKEGTFN
jgi:arabinogalactan oligomer/maltooligosaccharide transport system permease protein